MRPSLALDPRALEIFGDRLDRACPYLFLVLALATSLFLAWNLPPYMGADEPAHLERADLTTLGRIAGERVQQPARDVAGGPTDLAIIQAEDPFWGMAFHPEKKVHAADYAQADAARLDGETITDVYPGSAISPPLFYLPQSLALAVGKLSRWPVTNAIYLARAANALACAAVGFFALLLSGRSRWLMFAVLLLPMSQSLFGSVSPDGLLIAVAVLGCALVGGPVAAGRPMTGRELIAAAVCFALVGLAKPPYAVMALLLPAVDTERPRWRIPATAAALGVAIAWAVWSAAFVQTNMIRADTALDPGEQVHFLLTRPWVIPSLAWRTLQANLGAYYQSFVGVLGWLDTFLPGSYYRAAGWVLTLAVLASVSTGRTRRWRALPIVAALVLLAAIGAIHAALYIGWNGVAAPVVEGVAGRYFLPLVPLLCLTLEAERAPSAGVRTAQIALAAIVAAFPLVSLLVVERAVILRYYLT